MTLMLQGKPQFDPEFGIQIYHTDAVMTFGADPNVLPRIVLIFWICHIVAEDIIFHVFIVDRVHKFSAVGTVDTWLPFAFRV